MDKRIKILLILYSISVVISYSLMQNKIWYLLGLVSILSIFFYMLFVILKYQKMISLLNGKNQHYQNELLSLENNFEEELIKKTEKIVLKCEESKLISLKEMIQNISHQWRQPLSAISMIATSMHIEQSKDILQLQQVKKSCYMVNEYVQYLSETLEMLDCSLFTNNGKSVFKLSNCIEEFLHIFQVNMRILNLKIEYVIEEDFSVYSYKKELMQVLIHIINNSKDIFEQRDIKKRYILIELSQNKDQFIIKIQDNGGGIEEKIINRVFEPYFTTKHQSQGTGLGLYSVYLIVNKKLKGNISVQNIEWDNGNNKEHYKGASFIITAPIT